jgi:ABC-type nitrate/sulfonate/bicarbonate transport system substrate-binding protein
MSAVALGWNLEKQKKGRPAASEFVGPFLLNAIYARNDFIKEHPEAVRGFLQGWYETVNFMATHRAETIQFENEIDHFFLAGGQREAIRHGDADLTRLEGRVRLPAITAW